MGTSAPPTAPGEAGALRVSITGSPKVSEVLTAQAALPDGWAAPTYQWRINGRDIPGATGQRLTVRPQDIGGGLAVRVTASRPAYDDATGTAPAVRIARGAAAQATLTLAGAVKVGSTVSAVGVPAGWSATYQWMRGATRITGATGAAYKVAPADVKQNLAVRATLTRDGHASTTLASKTVKVPKIKAKVKVKAKFKAGKIVVKVRVKATSFAKPAGKLRVKVDGKKRVTVKLKAAHKAKRTIKIVPRRSGTSKVKVTFLKSAKVAKKSAKAVRVTVK
jgi:hypothetical protein